jgi:DNA-binding response OmpR family regulator
LLVEDDEAFREMVQLALQRAGFDVYTCGDGVAALALLEASGEPTRPPVDLVLTDVNLPEASGFEVLAGTRERFPQLPVVLMTALSDGQVGRRARSLGAETVIAKPVSLEHLIATLRRALEG